MAETLQLKKHVRISGAIVCKSGLRIGGSKEEIQPGAIDNPVIRDPVSGLPYIPGSSLKGKMRSALEYKYGRVGNDGSPCGCGNCDVCRVFGPHRNLRHQLGPTRIIVRDALLSIESAAIAERVIKEGGSYAEVKSETAIDRRTGAAADRSLRNHERIPAGAKFDFEIMLRIFQGDSEEKVLNFVLEGLDLIQKEYLGGSGTRGYGWIAISHTVTNPA